MTDALETSPAERWCRIALLDINTALFISRDGTAHYVGDMQVRGWRRAQSVTVMPDRKIVHTLEVRAEDAVALELAGLAYAYSP